MKIKHHILCANNELLETMLNDHKVKYSYFSIDSSDTSRLLFDIYEEDDYYYEVRRSIRDAPLLEICWYEYSKEDLITAQYLTVRSFTPSVELVREEEAFITTKPCNHRAFSGTSFYLKKPVNWRKTHFASTYNLGQLYLFCDTYAKEFFEEENVPVEFRQTRLGRTGLPIEDAFYVDIKDVLSEEAIIITDGLKKKERCPYCGKNYYYFDNSSAFRLHIRKEYLGTAKRICRTPGVFRFGGGFGESFSIISNELYRRMMSDPRYMTKHLVFEPVVLE